MLGWRGLTIVIGLCITAAHSGGWPARAHACSGLYCAGQADMGGAGSEVHSAAGVISTTCAFCGVPEALVAEPLEGGPGTPGTWHDFGIHEHYARSERRLAWVPDAPLAMGRYALRGAGEAFFCEGAPELVVDGPAPAAAALVPEFQVAYQTMPAGTVFECEWGHGSHCGPRRVATRRAERPHVLMRVPDADGTSAILVRLTGETEAGPIHGPWTAADAWLGDFPLVDGRGEVMGDQFDPGLSFPAAQPEYCVALEVLDLMTQSSTQVGRACLPHPQTLRLAEAPSRPQECDRDTDPPGRVDDYEAAYCRDNHADCTGARAKDRACEEYAALCPATTASPGTGCRIGAGSQPFNSAPAVALLLGFRWLRRRGRGRCAGSGLSQAQ